ncbi:MAG TPA: MBG domain-containing protein, partial [Dongiaceae bacterium]|nr:MBG domain-containing protein [Dongiaceae bacterium]
MSWNPSTNTDVVGYNLYYGGASQTYTNMASVGDSTNATITGLIAGDEYFFAATAVDSVGLESVFSSEYSYQVPGGQPAPALSPITWPTPTAIVYGTALGAGQLNAASSVPGIFTYNPPSGTVLGAGNYVLSVSFNPTDTNSYAPVTTNVAVVVLPAALTITANNASKLYGAALPALSASYSGFVNGDTAGSLTTPPAFSATATAASVAGSYPITASGAAGSNYTISYVSGTLSVNAAALTITAVNTSKLYGAALPALSASYSGFVNGDTASSLTTRPVLSTTATAASAVGSYPITVSGAAGSNYTISYVSGTLSVNAAALTITAVNTSKLYGAALPALSASYSGFVNGNTASNLTTRPVLSTTATAASAVGSYPITAGGAASPNYTITYVGGTLTVNKAALRITANNASKLYGAALPALSASYSGFVNGNTAGNLTARPVLSTTATAASPVGQYPITASGAASPNYTFSYVSGTLTVTKNGQRLIIETNLSGMLAITNLGDGS